MKTPLKFDEEGDVTDADGVPIVCWTLADCQLNPDPDPRDEILRRVNSYTAIDQALRAAKLFDDTLNLAGAAPTGDDYNTLYALVENLRATLDGKAAPDGVAEALASGAGVPLLTVVNRFEEYTDYCGDLFVAGSVVVEMGLTMVANGAPYLTFHVGDLDKQGEGVEYPITKAQADEILTHCTEGE